MGETGNTMKTAGVVPCQAGWISVTFDEGLQHYKVLRGENELSELFELTGRLFIHIPIGLCDDSYSRTCEDLLKKELGEIAKDHIIHAPVRSVLHAPSYVEASMQSLENTDQELSLQSWKLTPKIKIVDRLLRESEEVAEKVYESHPELLFTRLNGGVIYQSKLTRKGLRHRLELVTSEEEIAADFFREIKEEFRRNEVGEEEILGAMALAYGAKASIQTRIRSLPDPPLVDSEGLRMAIYYI
ncbi:MAG: DUF429 domain-containing protein [Balneolaceae bacterium]